MIRRQRVVRLLAALVVAAEGVGPDEVLRVLHAKPLRAVVGVGHHVQAVQSLASAHAVGGHVTLELHVLEVIRALVAVLVLHPRDGALAFVADERDAAGRANLFGFVGVEVLGVAVVAVDGFSLLYGVHQRVVAPVIDVHAEALQQLVGVARERDVSDDQERIVVVLVCDVGASLLRPLDIVECVSELPGSEVAVGEVVVAIVLYRPGFLAQGGGIERHDDDVERMTGASGVSGCEFIDCSHVVRDAVELTGDELALVTHGDHLSVCRFDGFHLRAEVVILAQGVHGDDLCLVFQTIQCYCHICKF